METVGAAEWIRDNTLQDFIRFCRFIGTCVYSLLELTNFKIAFSFGFVSRSFFYRFLNRNFNVWDFQILVLAWKVLQHLLIMKIVLNEFRDRILSFFEILGGRSSIFLSLESGLENTTFLKI